jgi:hypothetical protein
MSTIQNIHSSGLSLLNNLIRDDNNIKIKVPSTANPAIFSQTIPFKAMISSIDVADTKLDSNLTIDTKVCKLIIADLAKILNCPTSDYKTRGIMIENKGKTYSIVREVLDAFETTIILYLNRKV